MSFKPTMPFAGSSYLTDVAADLATSTGHRRIVIGFPTVPTAQQLAGQAATYGYDPQTANNNAGVFAAATQSADTEFVLISGRIGRPDAFDLVQQLHNDPRTAQLPIGVMGELADLQLQTKRFAPEPKVFVVYRPQEIAATAGRRLSSAERGAKCCDQTAVTDGRKAVGNGCSHCESRCAVGRPHYSADAAAAGSDGGSRLAGGDGQIAAGGVRRAAL